MKGATPTFKIIQELAADFPVSLLCSVAKVSRSGYYAWLRKQHTPSAHHEENEKLKEQIMACYREVNGIYGYRRVTVWLRKKHGIHVNHKRVYRLMKELGIQSRIRKKRKFFGYKERTITCENKLNRDFSAAAPNQKWATDITYLSFNGRRLYLSAIYDLFNNEVVSYKISHRNDLRLVMDTVKDAEKERATKGVLLHSDQGFQYTSKQYHRRLQEYGITASMSRKGNCLDNACVESFFGHLKTECFYLHSFTADAEVRDTIDQYIHFYNHDRFQSRLKNLSPVEYRSIS